MKNRLNNGYMPPGIKTQLITVEDGLVLYRAGISSDPNYKSYFENFSRDTIEAGLTLEDPIMLRDQIIFGNRHQAKSPNPLTAAEPWKYHHQMPGAECGKGLYTTYCATDSTADYFMAHAFYQRETGDNSLTEEFRENILRAVEVYTFSHINPKTYQFEEDPKFCGAEDFALKRTDWKDSGTPDREDNKVIYSVVYPLIQTQYMRGLRDVSFLFGTKEFAKESDKMRKGLQNLFDPELGCLYIAKDAQGPIRGVSSDGLNMLIFLQPEDLTVKQLEAIIRSSQVLETRAGFLNLDPKIAETMSDDYHTRVWPKEQANIHKGARKWRSWIEKSGPSYLLEMLDYVLEVSSRVLRFLDTNPETLRVSNGYVEKAGCDPQLWTFAAKEYLKAVGVRFELTVKLPPHDLSRIAS